MTLSFFLNGNETEFTAPTEQRLSSVLQSECRGINRGCGKGECGCCLVLIDNRPFYSCQIPFFSMKNRAVVTIDGIVNDPLFQDILNGFKRASVNICDFCAPARVLSIYYLLLKKNTPSQKEIEEILRSVSCSCSHYSALQRGIIFAIEEKHRRLHGKV